MSSKVFIAVAFALSLGIGAAPATAGPTRPMAVVQPRVTHPRVAMMGTLSDGRVVTVYTNGRAVIAPPRTSPTNARAALSSRTAMAGRRTIQVGLSSVRYGPLTGTITPAQRRKILFDLEHPPQPYVPGRVIVAFKAGVTIPQDLDALAPADALTLRKAAGANRRDISPHAFTTDARTNLTLMHLGVDRAQRLFSKVDRGTLSSMRARAEARAGHQLVAFDNAFALHVGASSVSNAVRTLRALPAVAYVSPDYAVDSMLSQRTALPPAALQELTGLRRPARTFGRATKSVAAAATPTIPTNTAISFDLQALLNAPGVDAVAAFDEIGQRFSQLPGAGEIITNVGLGDVDDPSAGQNPNDPCYYFAAYAPTTHLIGGQRYLDFPSLPLIPVWVSDQNGDLSPTAEVCGVDPELAEVGLDFSVMSALPDNAQRAGATDTTGADLLGIAPGASYRWIAPGMTDGTLGTTDILGAFIGASRQAPAPNVITASIGFGYDGDGFPSRYLEDDPLSESVVAAVVSSNIVVCIAANDGTRDLTAAAIGPSGGSAATNVGTNTTNVDDMGFTTAPSVDTDSGAIDVGASTLDDIIAANPQNPATANLAATKAFSETRFDGQLGFSSGFGSRVNASAPGDNIEALLLVGPAYNSVSVELVGGTSASAPETAAAAAIALQMGRLAGQPISSPSQVRSLLAGTGTPVANPPDSDVALNVGPQIDVRKVVEQILAAAGKPVQPGIARVAVQGRRSGGFIAEANTRYLNDAVYVTTLDPSYIKLDGPFTMAGTDDALTFPGSDTGAELHSYITIAPDWEGIPANATYRLAVAGQPSRVIATTPYARFLPAQLFAAAGVPLTPGVSRTLSLTYSASVGFHDLAESTFQLTFGSPAVSSRLLLAPSVPSVVSGSSIPVTYDFRSYSHQLIGTPTLNVSMPGNASHQLGNIGLYPYYSVPLSASSGTVNVPVSALAGAGTYTIWIDLQSGVTAFPSDISDLAFTRVDAGTARPPAPLLSLGTGYAGTHTLDVPYKAPFTVGYDVSHVPGATGAIVEFAAPPPAPFFAFPTISGAYNTFRNPNGDRLDDDGVFTGSIYHVTANGTVGSVTIDPTIAGLPATATVNVRVLATRGGTTTGEASDAGTVDYHGIQSALGGPLNALQFDPSGTDGFMTEYGAFGPLEANLVLATIEPFDVSTGANGGVSLAFTNNGIVTSPIVQNDVEVSEDTLDFNVINFYRAVPLGAGFASFTFPPSVIAPTTYVSIVAPNSSPTRSAYLAFDFATNSFQVTRGDVTTGNGFSPPIDVTALLDGASAGDVATQTFSYDPTTDRAYVLVEPDNGDCSTISPQLVTIDFNTRTATSRTLPIAGGSQNFDGYQMALDPSTGVAAIATSCQYVSAGSDVFQAQLSLLNLTTGSITQVFEHALGEDPTESHGFIGMVGGASPVIEIDPVHHLVLQRSMYCPSLVRLLDGNFRPCLNEYDESGRLAKTVPNLFPAGAISGEVANGVNGTARLGVGMGQEVSTPWIYSFEVQPFSY